MAIPNERCPATGKLRWSNEREARDELVHMRRARRTQGSKKDHEKRVFKCTDCDGFHLTSLAVYHHRRSDRY